MEPGMRRPPVEFSWKPELWLLASGGGCHCFGDCSISGPRCFCICGSRMLGVGRGIGTTARLSTARRPGMKAGSALIEEIRLSLTGTSLGISSPCPKEGCCELVSRPRLVGSWDWVTAQPSGIFLSLVHRLADISILLLYPEFQTAKQDWLPRHPPLLKKPFLSGESLRNLGNI